MLRRGRVVALHDDVVTVQVARAGCERCAAGQGCGAGLLTRLLTPEHFEIRMPLAEFPQFTSEADGAEPVASMAVPLVGQTVWLALDADQVMRLSLRVYGLSLAGFMVGCAIAYGSLSRIIDGPWLDGAVLALGVIGTGLCWRYFGPISEAMSVVPGIRVLAIGSRDDSNVSAHCTKA